MFAQLLPQRIDSTYRAPSSHPASAPIVAMKMLQSLLSIFSGIFGDVCRRYPLDAYTPAGAQTVVALFALPDSPA